MLRNESKHMTIRFNEWMYIGIFKKNGEFKIIVGRVPLKIIIGGVKKQKAIHCIKGSIL